MTGTGPESEAIRAKKAEIDEHFNKMGGMKGEMNGCGKSSIDCDSDSGSGSESDGSKKSVKGAGKKRARFVKGSQEAKDHMAAIRAKRKPKTQ